MSWESGEGLRGATSSAVPNRVNNLRLACKKIDGTVLEPGETFSFDAVVGQRTKKRGFKKANFVL